MKLEKKVNIIELLTFAALIIGAIFGYFLNKRYDALQASSSARLNEIQIEIANIEKNYKKTISEAIIKEKSQSVLESSANTILNQIEASIAEIEKNHRKLLIESELSKNAIDFSINVSDFISDIQPNIEIHAQPEGEWDVANKTFCIKWEITNIGKHTVLIKTPTILLSKRIIEKDANDNTLLKAGIDYELLSRMGIGELPPGQKTFHTWEIKIRDDVMPRRIYHYSKFSCQIHSSIKKIAFEFLSNHLNKKQIDDLTERSFGRHGWATFNRK